MATVQYYPGRTSDVGRTASAGIVVPGTDTDTSVQVYTGWGGDTYTFTGHDFVYENNALVSGVVTELVYMAGGTEYRRITDIEWTFSASDPSSPFIWSESSPEPRILGGDDIISGSRAADYIFGYDGHDIITSGKGRDVLWGGAGDDVLKGGGNRDIFRFELGAGDDKIIDFNASRPNRDLINIYGVDERTDVHIFQQGRNVVIEYGEDDSITLRHVDLDDLSEKNFIL